MVPDLYISWHAGKSSWKKIKSLNLILLVLKFLIQGMTINIQNLKKNKLNLFFFNY